MMLRSERRVSKIKEVLRNRWTDFTVVLENIHDPHNVSAILRTCDAVGVPRVELLYSDEPFPEIGKKSSSSAYKWVDRRKFRSVDSCMTTLHEDGYVVCATSLDPESRSIYNLDLTRKIAMVFGNEHRGVSDNVARMSDELMKIPMRGMIESLNVSVACGICLFEAFRQRLVRGHHPAQSPEELELHFHEWIKR
jgi:tRNA (guanosine-2'-O-)-methyltransferase